MLKESIKKLFILLIIIQNSIKTCTYWINFQFNVNRKNFNIGSVFPKGYENSANYLKKLVKKRL